MNAGSLKDLIEFKQTPSLVEKIDFSQWQKVAAYICHEVLKVLYFLQKQKHIHHRDIKPGNIGLNY